MSLNAKQVQQLIQKSPAKESLELAQKHENRLKLHAETEVDFGRLNPAYRDFLSWVQELLPKQKYIRFCELIKTPFTTNGITNEIFTELARMFDGQNSYYNYEFKNTDLQQDFNEYLRTKLDDLNFFRTKGFDQLKTGINSVLVVDLPEEVVGQRLDPVYYFVNVCNIKHIEVNHKGDIETIIFQLAKDLIAVYDKEDYQIFIDNDGTLTERSNSPHNLGYCPASFFWNKNIKKDNQILKKSPITDSLSDLDYYLFTHTSKEHADQYTSYPIVVAMKEKCTFDRCEGGWITEEKTYYELGKERRTNTKSKCPSCEESKLIGAGTVYKYNAPQTKDSPDLSSPVKILSSDIKPLEYVNEKLIQLATKIKSETIGTGTKAINDQAINEIQVLGSFESRRNVLINVSESMQKIHKFANDTVAILRYGDNFVQSTVYYGDEFYLKNTKTLQEEYKNAKLNGEPDEEVDSIYRQIVHSKYRGNPNKIQRAMILYNLNPIPHKNLEQSEKLLTLNAISLEDFVIKALFTSFIARFERENGNILLFGELMEFDKKIETINSQLKIYANEQIGNGTEEPATTV